jgi:hypothetical protein
LDRQAHAGTQGYPSTYRPIPAERGIFQRAAFDPALKQFPKAYGAGEPEFTTSTSHWAGETHGRRQ